MEIAAIINEARPAFERIEKVYVDKGQVVPVDFAREADFASQLLSANDYLAKMPANTIINAIKNVALCGITLNPAMKLAYLVPRDGRACLDISYMGLIKIATDSGSVTKVDCQLVYKEDFFQVEHGTNESLIHRPDVFSERGKIIGVYAIATLHNGEKVVETMRMAEVNEIKERSQSYKAGGNSPWKTDEGEMIRKTCVKRGSKYWPKTERLQTAIATLNEHEGYVDLNNAGTSAQGANSEAEQPIDETLTLQKEVMKILKAEAKAEEKEIKVYADDAYGIKSVAEMDAGQCKAFIDAANGIVEGEVVEKGDES